jgi:hypothetical protein
MDQSEILKVQLDSVKQTQLQLLTARDEYSLPARPLNFSSHSIACSALRVIRLGALLIFHQSGVALHACIASERVKQDAQRGKRPYQHCPRRQIQQGGKHQADGITCRAQPIARSEAATGVMA